jgi:hypothetical protein
MNTHNLEPGQWLFNLSFAPLVQMEITRKVQFHVRVLPVKAPQGPRPYSVNWAYYEYPPSGLYPDACFEDQKKHYTNVVILPSCASAVDLLEFDAQGKPAADPDFSELDRWIDRFGTKGYLYVFRADYVRFPAALGGKDRLKDPQAQANFRWYVGKVREHFKKRGMGVRDFAWYASDEPDLAKAKGVAKFGQLMMQADPEQQVFVTVYQAQKPEWLKIMAPYVNLWVMKLNISDEQKKVIHGGRKARYFSYTVLSRGASPYWSYRLEAMRALAANCEGIGFWSYDAAGQTRDSSMWLAHSGRGGTQYAVIYEGQNGPVPSVRWEAWREGIQDYRLVDWLRPLAQTCPDATLARKSGQLGKTVPETILKTRDMTTADTCRVQVKDMILRLLVAKGELDRQALQRIQCPAAVCLTGNDITAFENVSSDGNYTYNDFPRSPHGETVGIKRGKVPFRDRSAKQGETSKTSPAGKLTDGNLRYPDGWVFNNADPWIITFDLKKTHTLSHAVMLFEVLPRPKELRFTVSLSDTGEENHWRTVDEIRLERMVVMGKHRMIPKDSRHRTDSNLFIRFNLKNQSARFVRLELQTRGRSTRLGEVQIFGRAKESKTNSSDK